MNSCQSTSETGLKPKQYIEVRASLSKAKFLSFCLHNVPTWAPEITALILVLTESLKFYSIN